MRLPPLHGLRAAHVWHSAASGNEGGWQVTRCLELLSVLTGSIGTRGGTSPDTWDKFHPRDAERLAVDLGSLLKVHTGTGYFVMRVWIIEAIRPGVMACAHYLGRWRLDRGISGDHWSRCSPIYSR
jgi:anaerobic selenocysteine-containing dehydrogenase